MTSVLILVFSVFSFFNPSQEVTSEKTTTYYFIRHAEKDTSDPQNKDPHLTEAGLQRAQKWTEVFKEVEFDLIFSSDFSRTRKTAQIIADSQEKNVEMYDPRNLNDAEFQKKSQGKTVLVVGTAIPILILSTSCSEKKNTRISMRPRAAAFLLFMFPRVALKPARYSILIEFDVQDFIFYFRNFFQPPFFIQFIEFLQGR